MDYIQLGNSDLKVSRFCLGCMGFGDAAAGMHSWVLGEEDSRRIIRAALEQGINFFDTAMSYQGGTGEEFLGRAVRDLARRQDVVLATKFMPRTPAEIEAGVTGQQHVTQLLDASLRRLGTDYVDLYICHMWDYNTPIEELLEGLHQAVQAGKVRAIGISNCYAWQLAQANEIAKANGWTPFVSVQGHYNLIFREEEREMAGCCRAGNIAMTPYSALAAGRLARLPGRTTKRLAEDRYAMGKYDGMARQDEGIIRRVAELAQQRGVSMAAVALAWLLTKTTAPVVGATRTDQLDGAVQALTVRLTDGECAWLEELYVPHPLVGVMAGR